MNIIYVSCTCSKKKFAELFKIKNYIPGQQVQKYHRLITEGLAANNVCVQTVTALPVTKNNHNKRIVNVENDEDNGVIYNYLPILNIPYIKNVLVFICSFFATLKFLARDKQTVIICDVLNISVTAGALLAAKFMKRKNVGIVTDVPAFLSKNANSFSVKINNFIIDKFDLYVFLTEQMNRLINKRHVPYVVIEGQVDIRMQYIENDLKRKYKQKVCIYAGGIQEIYGIKNLTEAFIGASIQDSALHIYGNGDFENELIEICKNHNNIKYFGVVPNDEVVEAELKATLLINPRPSTEEFTKYSFPSKNMEYMVSATPVLTTRLPGMPEGYYDYIYIIENETQEGMKKALEQVLSKSGEELHEKGNKAKDFVLKEKNNIIQVRKIIEMIKSGLYDED
ncbi:MAG: glycosyltransferase [Tissierellia bacterium]|jgi:glycosyltransferase involved in cell wall biosynthesis|nr:glycosyltransferase [Tissierellia bacterium]